jgi:hypothetical protein
MTGTVRRFPGTGGWVYVAVPETYTGELRAKRQAWGKYPIVATVGSTTWETKLMTMKGGDFFIALREVIRQKENIAVGDTVSVSFTLVRGAGGVNTARVLKNPLWWS